MDLNEYKKKYINRVQFFQTISLVLNSIYALYNIHLGYITKSWWFVTMFIYYIVLASSRFIVIFNKTFNLHKSDIFIMKSNGTLMVFLSFILIISDVLYFTLKNGKTYNKLMLIPLSIWTISKLCIAIYNSIKAKQSGSPFIMVLRNISLAEAIASIMTVERSVIKTLEGNGNRFTLFIDIMFGSITSIFVIIIGLNMFSKALDARKN